MYKYYINILDIPNRYIPKLLFMMRLTTIILIASMLQVSATGFAQSLTYQRKTTTLLQLFNEIKAQTGYNTVWPEQDVKTSTTIRANFKNTPIKEVLDQSLKGLNLTYLINNKTIIIRKVKPTLLDKANGILNTVQQFFRSINITGRVLDDQEQPISGAVIKVKGSNQATLTNANGQFQLDNVDENATIVISYLGYIAQERKAVQDIGTVKLALSIGDLKEIEINAGYYTIKDRERTGSIAKVDAKTIERQPINNPLQAMQGRVAGVEIVQNTGIPGGSFNVRIRGRNSITNGNEPLYVVNGVPFISTSMSSGTLNVLISPNASPLSAINPADIESIEILKDADATAIYGSRGANGVVLISTKKGKTGETKIIADFYQGMGNVTRTIKLLNTQQYIEMRKEAFANDNANPGTADYDVNGTWDQTRYTDWQKELIGGTANTTNGQLSLSGGNANTTFLVSGTYYRESTVFPGDNNYQKKSTYLNIDHRSANQKFKAQFSASYNIENSNLPKTDLTNGIMLAPNAPALFTPEGDLNWENGTFFNPLANLKSNFYARTGTLNTAGNLSYRILPQLVFTTRIGYLRMDRNERVTNPLSSLFPSGTLTANNRTANYVSNWNQTLNIEPQLSWEAKIGNGKLSLLAGSTILENSLHTETLRGVGFVNDGLMENIAAASTVTVNNASNADYRFLSIYGRINYSLRDRYFINLTGRRDGSSRFGPENIYADFGALGAAWIFTEESFMVKKLPFLSFGKLRGSYGTTGNDQIGDYKYLELWAPTANNYQSAAGLFPNGLANPVYAWETNAKAEIALELGFLNDRFHLTTGYYSSRSSNQLINYTLPASTGFSSILRNFPATIQNMGWEFDLLCRLYHKADFKWTTAINLTIPKNKLIDFPNLFRSSYNSSFAIGESLNILKGLQSTGVDPQTGIYTFVDFDGSGTVSSPGDRLVIKTLGQEYSGGFQHSLSYKNLELDFLLQFVKQTGRTAMTNIGSAPGGLSNQPVQVINRWRSAGDVASVQKYTVSAATLPYFYARAYGDLSIGDASFIRLKNVSLAYKLSDKTVKSLGLKSTRIYLQSQNLITLTRFLGTDPESQNFIGLPPLRMITAGLQVSL